MYILPFDHRSSFAKLLGYEGELKCKQIAQIKKYKKLIFKAFLKVWKQTSLAERDKLGVLIDPVFGLRLIKCAKRKKMNIIVTQEKSGQKVFDFEYGEKWRKKLLKIRPTFAKVLVRYNPANKKDNSIQLRRLKELSNFCKQIGVGLLFEMIVDPTPAQLKKYGGKRTLFEQKLRPQLTVKAIDEVTKAKIKVDVWKLEPQYAEADWAKIIEAIKKGQRHEIKIVVLGSGDLTKNDVKARLKVAAKFNEIIGFAVGRTIFVGPLEKYRDGIFSKKMAIYHLAREFNEYINYWEKLRS